MNSEDGFLPYRHGLRTFKRMLLSTVSVHALTLMDAGKPKPETTYDANGLKVRPESTFGAMPA